MVTDTTRSAWVFAGIAFRHFAAGLGLCVLLAFSSAEARADASATADSRNWFFNKYSNGDSTNTTYWSAANAAKATFSEEAQAWNEGGTSGLKTYGPSSKFPTGLPLNIGLVWPKLKAEVPAPGTTLAGGHVEGNSYIRAGTLWGTNYEAGGLVFQSIFSGTIPPGGFGEAYSKLADPWEIDLPKLPSDGTSSITVNGNTFPSSTTDRLTMHAFLDMSGSSMSLGFGGSGTMEWDVMMAGLNGSSPTEIFHYNFSDNSSGFVSTLTVAPGTQLYLNNFIPTVSDPQPDGYNVPLEFDGSTAVSEDELKAILDGYQQTGGWSTGNNPVLIGMQFDIPNSATGILGDLTLDPSQREFIYYSEVSSTIQAIPEPTSVFLFGTGLIFLFHKERKKLVRLCLMSLMIVTRLGRHGAAWPVCLPMQRIKQPGEAGEVATSSPQQWTQQWTNTVCDRGGRLRRQGRRS